MDGYPQYFPDYFNYGGVLSGIFTPTEASAIAVIYTLFLALVLYREISVRDLPKIFLESVITTAIVGNDSNLLIVFYVQIMPDDFVMQLHRF
ncbi:transporter [Escherichia coli]|nr:transporter [Escherichia coli]